MFRATIILSLMILFSCTESKSTRDKKTVDLKDTARNILVNNKVRIGIKNEDIQKSILSNQIDKVEILCLFFGEYYDNSFRIFLSNYEVKIVDSDDENNTIYIGSERDRDKMIQYINKFYIDKTNEIVSDVKSKQEQFETDYPFIRVIGQKGKVQVLKKDVTLKDNIVFSPVFLEFYNFLDSLVKEK